MKNRIARSFLALALIAGSMICITPPGATAAEQSVTPPPRATNDGMKLHDLLGAAQANFDELYDGAGNVQVVTYAATTNLDFTAGQLKTVTLTGNVTFTTTNLAAGQTVVVRAIGSGGTRTFTFPAGWVFVGAAAPASVASGKTGLLVLRSFGAADSAVVAKYDAQP